MSELKQSGKITHILPEVTGTSKAGKEWKKRNFVINTGGDYPDDICFTVFGDKSANVAELKVGQDINVWFNISSREFEGKWYHNINAWRWDATSANNAQVQNNQQPEKPLDDLPF